uniref:Huntingtin interacting protein K n=1 Tax=Propithecus coquereli TaxID=379532 RepID=A0A2K6FZ16_PROCO
MDLRRQNHGGGIRMATKGDVELELEAETSGPERPPEKPRKHDSGTADLEQVTDYVEEKEIQSSNLETKAKQAGEGTGKSHYQKGRSGAYNDRDGDLSSSRRKEKMNLKWITDKNIKRHQQI